MDAVDDVDGVGDRRAPPGESPVEDRGLVLGDRVQPLHYLQVAVAAEGRCRPGTSTGSIAGTVPSHIENLTSTSRA